MEGTLQQKEKNWSYVCMPAAWCSKFSINNLNYVTHSVAIENYLISLVINTIVFDILLF